MTTVRCAAETMLSRGKGSIFLTGGHFGLKPVPDYISLSVGKAGLRALALGAFDTFKGNGVQIAVVHVAGPVDPASDLAKGVGDCFWRLHTAPMSDWRAEHAYPS